MKFKQSKVQHNWQEMVSTNRDSSNSAAKLLNIFVRAHTVKRYRYSHTDRQLVESNNRNTDLFARESAPLQSGQHLVLGSEHIRAVLNHAHNYADYRARVVLVAEPRAVQQLSRNVP